jgi:Txe/YoeB family toxin of Txe-Axe toxin-antitoxin module
MIKKVRVLFQNNKKQQAYLNLPYTNEIKKSITKAIKNLQVNPFCGIQIQKLLIPREYSQFDNLWKVNLTSGWRLLYTVTSNNNVELIALILDWTNHTNYERKFKY